MLQLLINNQPVDISGNEEIAADYAMFDVKDMGSRKGTRSYSFKLPLTANNKRIFEIPTQLNNLSTMPYRRMHARALKDGIDLGIRFAELEEISDELEVRLYGGNSDFFELIKDKNLRDVNLRQYDHFRTHQLVAASRNNNSGYVYPLIDYFTQDEVTEINNTARSLKVNHMYPAVFADTLLQQMCADAGYTLQNDMLSDENYTAKPLLVPFNHTEFKRNYDGSRYLMEIRNTTDFVPERFSPGFNISVNSNPNFGGGYISLPPGSPALAPTPSSWVLHSTAGNYFTASDTSLYNNSKIKFADDVLVTLKYSFKIFNAGGNDQVTIHMLSYNTWYVKTFILVPGLNTIEDYDVILDVRPTTGDLNPHIRLYFNPYSLASLLTLKANSSLQIYNCEILTNNAIVNSNIYHPNTFNYVTLNSALPDMKQSDFLKSYCTLYGLLASVDETYKTIRLFRYDTIAANINNAYNWGNKLDISNDTSLTFSKNNTPRKTTFNYKLQQNVAAPGGTKGTIEISNTFNDDEKNIDVNFQYTTTHLRLLNLDLPVIELYKDGELGTKQEPRLLLLNRYHVTDFANHSPVRVYDDIFFTNYTDNVPVPYFIRPAESYNLGFGINLLGLYYGALVDILNNLKVLRLEVRLNAADINQLDFTRPVYLPQYSSYFYINKIQGYKYVQNDSTLVELVKLNIL